MLCQACVLCSPPEPVKAREDIFLYQDGANDKVYLRHLAFCHDEAKEGFFFARVHPMYTQILIIGMRRKRQNADL